MHSEIFMPTTQISYPILSGLRFNLSNLILSPIFLKIKLLNIYCSSTLKSPTQKNPTELPSPIIFLYS